MAALTVGLVLALFAGVMALIVPVGLLAWRLVRRILPRPSAVEMNHSDVEVIDVESTVVRTERTLSAERHTHDQ